MLDIGTSDSARSVTVNGAPVSEGNPLPVTFGQQAQLAAEGAEAFGGIGPGPGGSGGGASSATPSDDRTWWERTAPKWMGGKDAPAARGKDVGGTEVRAPEEAGKYRPVYKTGDKDLSDAVINTIAGEASTKNAAAIDAVVDNMMNRLGTKTYGPSGNLEEVARAPGQYTGYRQANATEAEFIRSRIKAISSGGLPDSTKGSNAYRADWYHGPWGWNHPDGIDIGGNVFAHNAKGGLGPYGAYADTHASPPSAQVANSAGPQSSIHIPNAYTGGQSSEYPAKTEHTYWQPPAHPEEHSSQVSANPYAPSWMPTFDEHWFHDTFSMPHAEAATLPQAEHTFNQTVNMNVDGATDPSIVAHQVASRINRSATDLTAQFKGALQ